MLITSMLKTGKENAIPGADLSEMLDVPIRVLAKMVETERRAGSPICASQGKPPGYYLAANRGEIEEYTDCLRKRAGEIFKTRRALVKAAQRLPE